MKTEYTSFPLVLHRRLRYLASAILVLLFVGVSTAQERVLCDFEDSASLRLWEKGDHIELSDAHATRGKKCAKITLDKAVVAGSWTRLPSDWSKYDHLRLDFFNPGDTVVLAVRIKDGNGKGYDLWSYKVPKGKHEAVFDLAKAGAKIDLSKIKQFWFHATGKSTPPRVLYLDNVRLTGHATPAAAPIPAAVPIPGLSPAAPAVPASPTLKRAKGATFRNIGIGGGGTMQYPSMSPFDRNLIQTSCDMGGRYVSRDGGRTWRIIPFWEMSGHTGKAVFDAKNMYIRGREKICVSSDKGDTWSISQGFPWNKDRMTLMKTVGKSRQALAVGTPTGLWLSPDGAKSWKPSHKGSCTDLVFLGDTLFLAGDKTLRISRDLGRTWSDITPRDARGKQIVSMAAGQDRTGMLLAALLDDRKTLFSSTDWGRTWQSSRVAGENARRGSILGMAPNQTKVVFLTRKYELWRSSDGGKTWARCCYFSKGVAPGLRESEFLGRHKWGLGLIHFAIDPTDTRRVIVTTMSDLFGSGDAGTTWRQGYNTELGRTDPKSKDFFCRTNGLTMTSAWHYRFDPFDTRYQYICYTDFGFLRSIDGGKSWATSAPANSTYAIQFDPYQPGRVYGAASGVHDIPGWGFVEDRPYTSGRVVYSDDRCDTWHTLGKGYPNKPCTSLTLDPTRSKKGRLVFWATFYGDGLYRSNDSGQNWQKVRGLGYPNNKHFLRVKVHPKTGEIYVAVSGIKRGMDFFQAGGLWHSSDDGKTWTDIAKSLDLRWQKGFALRPEQPGTIYLAASTPPRFPQGGIYKTSDNGKNWKHILDADTVKGLPNTAGFIHTYSVDLHPTKPNIIYACTGSHGLWVSQNDGRTWQFMDGVPHASTTHVTVDPNDEETIYVTTFGGGTWVGHYLP